MEKFRSLNSQELRQWVEKLRPEVLGKKVQAVITTDRGLAFRLSSGDSLVFDLSPLVPWFTVARVLPPSWSKKKSYPITLFAKAHFIGATLLDIQAVDSDRQLKFEFVVAEAEIELAQIVFWLIPRGVNLRLQVDSKTIHFSKPRDYPPPNDNFTLPPVDPKLIDRLNDLWLAGKVGASRAVEAIEVRRQTTLAKAIAKKREVLELLRDQLSHPPKYRELGEKLKSYSLGELSDELKNLYIRTETLSWNMERAFELAKQQERKSVGLTERVARLEEELENLAQDQGTVTELLSREGLTKKSGRNPTKSLLKVAGATGRTKKIDGDFEVVVGKNARDNLALLRKAKPWQVWLHLRDYPGAHAILFGPTKKGPNVLQLREAAEFLVLCSIRAKQVEVGARFSVVWVECGKVRPIKGDRLGRVTYHDSHHFEVSIS